MRSPLPCPVQLYEKRKLAALEVEQLVKQLATQGSTRRIEETIDLLVAYATSSQVGAVGGGRRFHAAQRMPQRRLHGGQRMAGG